MSTDKFDLVLARADRVMRQIDERDGAVKSAAQRERARLNAGLGRTLRRVTNRPVSVVQASEDGIGMIDRAAGLVRDHFCSMASNGEGAPSSLPWFTPSARAI